jgi:6-phosphogluconolactonase (cycloisomerase 2 family)/enamine deaminase RidA (YjgF/YER057c/UK114 family)
MWGLNALLGSHAADTSYDLIVGSYTKEGNPGIEVFSVQPPAHVSPPGHTIALPNSSFLALTSDGQRLFAVSEEGGGKATVSALARNEKGAFERLNSTPAGGDGPCHIVYREQSATVYVANYVSGSLSVFKTADGRMQPIAQHIRYKGTGAVKSRQDAPHAHQVILSPDGHSLFVTDLGTDRIHRHRIFSDGLVEETPQDIPVSPGGGPRHMVFNTAGDRAYLMNEISGMVDVFSLDASGLRPMQSVQADTTRAASKGSGDIHLSPNGKWLIATNRVSSNEVVVFSVRPDGSLVKAGHQPVAKRPRNFSFTPDGQYVYVASQDENRIQVFRFNDADGRLTDTRRDIAVKQPVCLIFAAPDRPVDPEERIRTLGIKMIQPTSPIANYVKYVQTGKLVFLSGHGPDKPEGGQVFGKVGGDLSVEQGQAAARLTGISLLSTLRGHIGDLNRVKRVVKVTGLVNCPSDFTKQPAVMNGFSDLMVEVFGDRGRHARTSVGVNALPNNIAVEIEMVVELK